MATLIPVYKPKMGEQLSEDQMDALFEKVLDVIRTVDAESARRVMLTAAYYVHTTVFHIEGFTDESAKHDWEASYDRSACIVGQPVRTSH